MLTIFTHDFSQTALHWRQHYFYTLIDFLVICCIKEAKQSEYFTNENAKSIPSQWVACLPQRWTNACLLSCRSFMNCTRWIPSMPPLTGSMTPITCWGWVLSVLQFDMRELKTLVSLILCSQLKLHLWTILLQNETFHT